MSEFTVVVACNRPRLIDLGAAQRVVSRFSVDRELNFGVRVHRDTGQPYLVLCGYKWPDAWPLPEGTDAAGFDPYQDDTVYAQGAEGFKELLRQLAPFLAEPLTVQAVGNTGALFPLVASEWHIEPGATTVNITEFRGQHRVQTVGVTGGA
jgi:hypothetical protein